MRQVKFIAAVIVAVAGGIFFWSSPWGRFIDAIRLLRNRDKAADDVYHHRLARCRGCPIYYKPLETCGTPLEDHDLGCWCHVPTKAKRKNATCWLRDRQPSQPFGWRQ